MAQAVEPERGAGSVTFEVERFEPRGADQLMLSGRWFGLRGRRFVRPTLTLGTGSSRSAHSPSSSTSRGRPTTASCGRRPSRSSATARTWGTSSSPLRPTSPSRCRRRAPLRASSGSGHARGATTFWTTCEGPVETAGLVADRAMAAIRGETAVPRQGGRKASRRSGRRLGCLKRLPPSQAGDADALAARLSQAQREIERLRAELARQDGVKVEAASALSRRDAAVNRLTEAIAARDQAARAYEQAVRARDQALRERDNMRKQLDRMAKDRDQALRDRDRAIAKANKAADAGLLASTTAPRRPIPPSPARGRRGPPPSCGRSAYSR